MIDKIKNIFIKYREQILYLFFGVCTTVVNLIVTFVCMKVLGMPLAAANLPAWVIAVLFAYVTNKIFVFESKTNTTKELLKEMLSFFAARLATLGLEEVITWIGVALFGSGDLASACIKIVCQVTVIVTNYIFSKLLIFKKKN